MSDRLVRLLEIRPWLLADGATGTNYFAMGLETSDAPELWNIDHPERVLELHRCFLEAGSDIILTNTFGGSRHRLKLHGAEDRIAELNSAAVRLARQAGEKCRREVVIAGSIGPTGAILEPIGPLSQTDAEAAFAEQATAMAEGGADVLWIETISSVEELEAAVRGAGTTGLPLVVTMSFDTHGRTMMGVTSAQAADLIHDLAPRALAYGGNCGIGPAETMAALINLGSSRKPDDILIAKSNCGVPEYVDGEIVYSGTPTLMADYARIALDAGVRIIGGCCGTTPEHIRVMRDALESHEPAAPPTLEDVVTRLGPISDGAKKLTVLGYLDLIAGKAEGGAGRRRRAGQKARRDDG